MFIPDPELGIPDPGLKKAQDSGSATQPVTMGVFLPTSDARKREEVERTVSNHSVVMPSP